MYRNFNARWGDNMEENKERIDLPQNEADKGKNNSTTKKIMNIVTVAVLSLVLIAVAVVAACFIVDKCGVDTTPTTPDEAAPTVSTTLPTQETSENTEPTTPDGKVYYIKQDWAELAGINSEIKAWINIPGTTVNYPVLRHEGDGVGYQYYLHRNYDKSYLFAGSVFIDYRSSKSVNSQNIITHGHNMNDGSMYGALLKYGKYQGDLSFYKSAPTLFFNTPAGNEQWIIFAVYKTNTLESHGDFFNYLMGDFSSDAQFMNYVYNVKERSFFDVPVPINENDQIITLSTCSYEYTDFRTVVVARKLRPGESASAYVSGATLNPNPVWPEVHHNSTGVPRPELTTFKTEYQKGNISWYDGAEEPQGSEWLVSVQGNKTYTVTFVNYDGTILSTQNVYHGHAAVAPEDPTKPENDYCSYKFVGWGLDFSNVHCNMTIAPIFEQVVKEQ